MRVAVLGAPGVRGRRVVRDLLDRPDVASVTLVGSAERDLSRLVGALDPRRVAAAAVPLTVEGIAEAFGPSDVAVGCLEHSPEAELTALEAARVAGVPYATSCESASTIRAMLAAGWIPPVQRPVVVGVSWSPGLSNVLVRAAAERLDAVDSVRVAWCTSRRDEGQDGIDRLLSGWDGEAEVIAGGMPETRRPGSQSDRVFFPEPVGWQRVHLVRGAEVATLPAFLPGLESLRVEGGMAGASASTLARLVARSPRTPESSGFPDDLASGPRRRMAVLARSVALGMGPLARPDSGWSGLRVDVAGLRGGSRQVEIYGVVDHLANLESVPLVEAALLLGRGGVARNAILAPEEALDPAPFLALLADRGLRVARLTRPGAAS